MVLTPRRTTLILVALVMLGFLSWFLTVAGVPGLPI